MKHLFIPYKLALQLKEKGFDEPCFTWFLNKKLEEDSAKFFFFTHSYRSHKGYKSVPAEEFISAPLYQQVVEWFYNKHRIFVEADGYIIDSGEYDGCYGFKATIRVAENYKEKILFTQGEFPTREKAWNKAIEETLKLI